MPSQSIKNFSPYELKYGKSPNLDCIKVFGCVAYLRIPESQRKKLNSKTIKIIFVGYSIMGYRLLDPDTKLCTVSRNVKFNEEKKAYLADVLSDNESPTQEEFEDSTSDKSNAPTKEKDSTTNSKR